MVADERHHFAFFSFFNGKNGALFFRWFDFCLLCGLLCVRRIKRPSLATGAFGHGISFRVLSGHSNAVQMDACVVPRFLQAE